MRVHDLMETTVATLELSDTLDVAEHIMRLGRIRHMPVLSHGRLVGILSQRDLFRASISSVLHFRRAAEEEWLAKIDVKAVMTRTVTTVPPDTSIRTAVELMLERKIGCLPVVENEKLIGLLSESDCMRYLARLLEIAGEKEALPELSRPA
jgi:CBS domain-containing membrane protein